MTLCECGCGQEVKEGNRFIFGHAWRGKHHSKEAKQKNREAHLGEKSGNYGKHFTEDHRRKISEATKGEKHYNYGKHPTEEQRQRMREGQLGRKHTEETKQKIHESHLGKKHPEVTIQKIQKSCKTTFSTPKHKQKLKDAHADFSGGNNPNYGKHLSEESKQKIREAVVDRIPWNKGTGNFYEYCEKFNEEFKERVRNYFDRCCYVCAKNEKDNGERLSVHHVNYEKMACCEQDIKPLFVPLCKSCHSKTNQNREFWEEFFTERLMFLTNGKCFLPRHK